MSPSAGGRPRHGSAHRPPTGELLPAALLSGVLLLMPAACDRPVGTAPAPPASPPPPLPRAAAIDLGAGTAMQFVLIPPGSFWMGSPPNEAGRMQDEVYHRVTIIRGFYLSATEVTQDQWQAVMGDNPSYLWGRHRPVEHVSWHDAVAFCRRLSAKVGAHCRLPTEAEWEYACRAGSAAAFCFGSDEDALADYAWYQGNASERKTHPVGWKRPNAWGLYDMHGSVREWCADWYGPYPDGPAADPTGPVEGTRRVFRGGSWGAVAHLCRSARRDGFRPEHREAYIGLRVVMEAAAGRWIPASRPVGMGARSDRG